MSPSIHYFYLQTVALHRLAKRSPSTDTCSLLDSDKFREMAAATESPPKGGFQFNDDQEYPPLTQRSD